jgi:hypothetical protein
LTRPTTKPRSNKGYNYKYPFIELTESNAVQKWIDELPLLIADGFEIWNTTDEIINMVQISLENELLTIVKKEEEKDGNYLGEY